MARRELDPTELSAGLVVHVEPRALDREANWRGRVWRDGVLLETVVVATPAVCMTNVVQLVADIMARDSADVAYSAMQAQIGHKPTWNRNITGRKGNRRTTRGRDGS